MKYILHKQLLLCAILFAFLMPSALIVMAGGLAYEYGTGPDYFVTDPDHSNYFYRMPFDFNGDVVSLNKEEFSYGYGYGSLNGAKSFGYGYGYGYEDYASLAYQVANNSSRLGFFFGNDTGESYDSAVLPIELGVANVPVDVSLVSEDAEVKLFGETTIEGPAEWDGTIQVSTLADKDDLADEYSDLVDLFDGTEDFYAVQLTANVEESLLLSDEAIILLPVTFDADVQSIYFGSVDGTTEEVLECSDTQFTGDATLVDDTINQDLYFLEQEDDCYIYNPTVPSVYLATRHFTAFAVGTGASSQSGGGSSGSKTPTSNELKMDFSDLDNHWASEFVSKLFARGLVSGKTIDTFDPSGFMNRAELAKVTFLSMGGVIPTDLKPLYSDVDLNAWYAPYVAGVLEKGIAKGYADGRFRPADLVTRAEALKMILVATGADLSDSKSGTFMDVPSDSWYSPYVKYAKTHNIVSGYEDGLFYPNKTVTRAEVAKMLSLALGL